MNRFLKPSTWKMIIESRLLHYKNSKEDWCKERREICGDCLHNSKNKYKLTFREKVFMFLQITKAICTVCGCSIKYITTIPDKSCSLESELNEKPKWKSIVNTKYKEKYDNRK